MPIIFNDAVDITLSDVESYVSIENGNLYFADRLNSQVWDDALDTNKAKALLAATRAIDKLSFLGEKHATTQKLEFPRGDDVLVPNPIIFACCEIAIKLLSGIDVNNEVNKLGVLSNSYQNTRTQYDPTFNPPHIIAGIISVEAWNYLLPYLRDVREIKLRRIS